MNWAGLNIALGLAALAWVIVTTAPAWFTIGLVVAGAIIWRRI